VALQKYVNYDNIFICAIIKYLVSALQQLIVLLFQIWNDHSIHLRSLYAK
jgi:hypothetical protein